jgi:hypothetical protein
VDPAPILCYLNSNERASFRRYLLQPGGLFRNLEHVAPRSQWAEQAFDDLFVDSLWLHDQRRGGTRTREDVADRWYHRPDNSENILAPVELQCQWLGEIGFQDVDCFFAKEEEEN